MTYNAKIRRTQGASALVVDAGGTIDITSGSVTLPGNLRRGFIPLNLFEARTLASGETFQSFNVSATGAALPTGSVGGLIGAGTVPALAMFSTAAQAAHISWTSGQNAAVCFPPVPIPPDFDSSAALTIHAMAERASDNASNNVLDMRFWNGNGATEMGTTGSTLTSSPAEISISVGTTALSAHPGYWNVQIVPGTHTNNAVRVFAAWLEYNKLSS